LVRRFTSPRAQRPETESSILSALVKLIVPSCCIILMRDWQGRNLDSPCRFDAFISEASSGKDQRFISMTKFGLEKRTNRQDQWKYKLQLPHRLSSFCNPGLIIKPGRVGALRRPDAAGRRPGCFRLLFLAELNHTKIFGAEFFLSRCQRFKNLPIRRYAQQRAARRFHFCALH
jgi:hypothetical protein